MTTTTGGITSNLSLPNDRWPLTDIRDAKPSSIGEVISAAVDFALQRSNASGGIKGMSRTTYVKGDLESLHRSFEVVLIGMMSQDIHAINEVIPIQVTDDYRAVSEELIFDPQLPKVSAPMSGPDMIHFRKTKRVTTSTKYNMGFELDGDLRRLEEGVEHIRLCMAYMAGAFNKMASFITMSGLIKSGLHDIHRRMLTRTMQLAQFEEWVNENHDEVAIGNKKRTGIDNALYKYSKIVQEMCGFAPDVCFFPSSQKALYYANKQYNTYHYGGQEAMEIYQGRQPINQKHGMRMLEAPLAPDQRLKYSQLYSTRRTGEFLMFEKKSDSHEWEEGFLVQELNRDDSMYNVKVDDLMPGLLFVKRASPDVSSSIGQNLSVKLKVVLDSYRVFSDLGLNKDNVSTYCNDNNGIIAKFMKEHDNLMKKFKQDDRPQYQELKTLIETCFHQLTLLKVEKDATKSIFKNEFFERNEQFEKSAGKLALSSLDFATQTEKYQKYNALVAELEAKPNKTPQDVQVLDELKKEPVPIPTVEHVTEPMRILALRQIIGDFIDTNLELLELPQKTLKDKEFLFLLHWAARLHDICKGAYTVLFRRNGVYGSGTTALGITWGKQTVFDILSKWKLTKVEQPYVVDFTQFYECVMKKNLHKIRGGTPFTNEDRTPDPKPWVVNASCYMEDDYVIGTYNPYETGRYSRVVVVVSGEQTAILFICPPEVTDGQDVYDQHLMFNTSMYYGYHPRNDRRVITINDLAYSGVISGANWKIFTYEKHEEFANQLYFDAPNNDYPCRVVLAMRKKDLKHRRFINLPGKPPVTGADNLEPDYPHAEFYNKIYHWDTCQSELRVPIEKKKKVVATCLYRAGYSYKDKTAGWIHIPPDTVHGPYSRQPNALSIRQRGDCLYEKTMD